MSPPRLLILLFLILAAAGALFTGFQASLLTLISLWLVDLPLALLWMLSAGGLGFSFLRLLLPKDRFAAPLPLISCFALGSGALSLLIFIIGALGLLHPALFYLLAVLPLLGWFGFPFSAVVIPKKISPLYLPLLILLAFALIAASIPPGFLWTPLGDPNPYDILEYHLQLPREWHDMRQIAPLAHNAYSWFPFNLEMHYLAAMFLRGGPYQGIYTAQYLNLFHMILAALALRAATPSRWPMLLFATAPWVFLLGTIPYNESSLLLHSALAVAWSLQSPDGLKKWILAGAFAGLAAGSKYTAVPLLFIAWPISLLLWKNRPNFRQLALYLLSALLLFSPWLIRNALRAKNPVFPEAMTLLGKGPFTTDQQHRWENAHAAAPEQRAPIQRFLAFNNQILTDARFGLFLFPAAVACAILFRKHPHALPLLTFLFLLTLFWLFFTHLQSRFFILAIIPASLLIPLALENTKTRWIPPLVFALSPLCLITLIAGMYRDHPELLKLDDTVGLTELDKINSQFPENYSPGQSILLVGDAKAFLYPVPSRLLHYKTVFDLDIQPGQTPKEAWSNNVSLNPGDKIVYDGPEIDRLSKSYLSDH